VKGEELVWSIKHVARKVDTQAHGSDRGDAMKNIVALKRAVFLITVSTLSCQASSPPPVPVVTTKNYYTIANFHTTNHSTLKTSQSIFTSLYLVTALHNGCSSAMSSLDVSWKRILAMEILPLLLPAD
jgi:hypothetical protein